MTSTATLRLLDDPPLDGVANMARDEALLTLVGGGESPPTLRLYQWSVPTISLGYFQKYADYLALPPPAGGLPVVRRPTGGGAILHDLELTYSLTLPMGHALLSGGPNALYELTHDAVMACLRELQLTPTRCGKSDDSGAARGPFFCFARRHCYDVLVGHDKIAGSAQRRTRHAVLQHGSIVLANRFAQQPTAVAAGPFAQSLAQLRTAFPQALQETTKVAGRPAHWSPSELDLAEELFAKYAGPDWTNRS
jgi:lipoate-protein ligase A